MQRPAVDPVWVRQLPETRSDSAASRPPLIRTPPGFLPAAVADGENDDADGDERVGDVEDRPAPVRADSEVEEVDHLPQANAVDDVAERPAENHGHRRPQQPRVGWQGAEQVRENDESHHRHEGVDLGAAEAETEGGAAVVDVGQAKETAENLYRVVPRHRRGDQELGSLVERQNQGNENEGEGKPPPRGFSVAARVTSC